MRLRKIEINILKSKQESRGKSAASEVFSAARCSSSAITTQNNEAASAAGGTETLLGIARPSDLSKDGCLLSSRHPDGLLGNSGW